MDRKAVLRLGALLMLALVVLVGLAGYGRQLREDFAHHSLMEAPEDRRALNEMLQVEEIRQRLLAEESDSPAPAPGPSSSDSASAPTSATYGSSAPSSPSSSSSSGSSSSSSSGSNSFGGIAAGRRLLQ